MIVEAAPVLIIYILQKATPNPREDEVGLWLELAHVSDRWTAGSLPGVCKILPGLVDWPVSSHCLWGKSPGVHTCALAQPHARPQVGLCGGRASGPRTMVLLAWAS